METRIGYSKNYNMMAMYEIVGRVPNGTTVAGYLVLNRVNGECSILPKDMVEQLALDKNIYNANAQIYNNVVNLKGINCKLSKLPRYNMSGHLIDDTEDNRKATPVLKIVGRVQNMKSITAYIIEYKTKDNELARKKVDKEKVIELARDGYIINAKAQLNNGILMLRGINEDLGALKTYKE